MKKLHFFAMDRVNAESRYMYTAPLAHFIDYHEDSRAQVALITDKLNADGITKTIKGTFNRFFTEHAEAAIIYMAYNSLLLVYPDAYQTFTELSRTVKGDLCIAIENRQEGFGLSFSENPDVYRIFKAA